MEDSIIVETVKKLRMSERLLSVPPTEIAPRATATIPLFPQWIFKPRRLILTQRFPSLVLLDYKVGANSQTVSVGGIKMDTFVTDDRLIALREQLADVVTKGTDAAAALLKLADGIEALANNLPSDTCQRGQILTLAIENVGPETVKFQACIRGTCVG